MKTSAKTKATAAPAEPSQTTAARKSPQPAGGLRLVGWTPEVQPSRRRRGLERAEKPPPP